MKTRRINSKKLTDKQKQHLIIYKDWLADSNQSYDVLAQKYDRSHTNIGSVINKCVKVYGFKLE